MDNINQIILKINIPTHEVTSQLIQEVLIEIQKSAKKPASEINQDKWIQISEMMWSHLHSGLNSFDDQLLCSTCFYSVLSLKNNKNILNRVGDIIKKEFLIKQKDLAIDKPNKISLAISLIYGMFQSTFLMQSYVNDFTYICVVLELSFEILVIMAYEYTQYTFLVFKIINSFKRVLGTQYEEIIYSYNNQITLLNLVNHNWENPITGIRDLNKDIFQTLILVMKDDMRNYVICEIDLFYWNKAKYLMLSEIIDQNKNMLALKKTDWIDGLMQSLGKPGLVSAGADMYFSILKNLRSQEEWCDLFLSGILKLLTSSSKRIIENFRNYWCIVTLKKFPLLLSVILKELEKIKNMNTKLFSCLSLLKQGNKLDLVKKNWGFCDFKNIEDLIINGLQYSNSYVRMLAFEIICTSQEIPNSIEYDQIILFVTNNINSDCTVLRLSLLSSLTSFLIRLQTLYINNKAITEKDVNNMLVFCEGIQKLVSYSLSLNGNYQRRITAIKICEIILTYMNEVPKKKKKQTRDVDKTLMKLLQDKKRWILHNESFITILIMFLKDPADDIKHSVVRLLLNHYSSTLRNPETLNSLIANALESTKGKFFYEISSATSTFKLISSTLIDAKNDLTMFKNVEDVFYYGYNELIKEVELKRNILHSIEKGKQLHSIISIIQAVIETCLQKSYFIKINKETIWELLRCLEFISNQFVCENDGVTSSDFSEMSDMIQNIIEKSGRNIYNTEDEAKISGLHQSVLNCLWLNLKASCDLSSLLIKYTNDDDTDVDIKILNIVTSVLETSRHKGAIEAAGVALGQCIVHLTSLPKHSSKAKLPLLLLKQKLDDLISETNKMISITRRGAGLSIMVYKIISSDTTKEKILFNYAMVKLLEVCKIPDCEYSANIDNQKDLPKAIYIHFLTRITADSSLASDMVSVKVAEIAFENLTSKYWQIRNAALQLYGALVPKLLGQKKGFGANEDTVATVAYDEFRTHSRKLWTFIENRIRDSDTQDKIELHSNLVPILNILANSAKRYNLSYDLLKQKQSDVLLLKSLMSLLNSPIYTVRRLTAKCIFNIFSFEEIHEALMKESFVKENALHGILLLLQICHQYYYAEHKDSFEEIWKKINDTNQHQNHSFVSRDIIESIFNVVDNVNEDIVTDILLTADINKNAPGVCLWANNKVKVCIKFSSWTSIPHIIKTVLNRDEFDIYCEFLYERMLEDGNITKETFREIATIFLSCEHKHKSSIMWKILYLISLKIDLTECGELYRDIPKFIKEKQINFKLRYLIPFCVRVFNDEGILQSLAEVILHLSNPENTGDVDMRHIAAEANNMLSEKIMNVNDTTKIIALTSVVILLQDEDEEVRYCAVNFYTNIQRTEITFHPYLCLQQLLNIKFLNTIWMDRLEQNIHIFCHNLLESLCKPPLAVSNDYNPFANDTKNIYLELNVLKSWIQNLKEHLIE